MSRDLRVGWAGSLVFHLLLLLFALFSTLPDIVRTPEFIEMQWGTLASAAAEERVKQPASQTPATSTPANKTPKPSPVRKQGAAASTVKRNISLPERRMPDMTDDMLAVQPRGEKLEATTGGGLPGMPQRSTQDREQDPLSVREGGEISGDKALPSASGAGLGTQGPGSGNVGKDVGYSVQWAGGGTRKRLSGKVPAYPEGANTRAQILIRAIVAPDGSVTSVTPVQKANSILEEAAMAELRLWKFEALRSNVPQVPQDCVVTFVFELK